jgi:hypothetical protein
MQNSMVQSLVSQLHKERTRLETELRRVSAALTAFGNVYAHGRQAKSSPVRKKHKISAAGRRRIAAAQKARWAKARAGKKGR